MFLTSSSLRSDPQYGSQLDRPTNLENVFRATFRVKKRDLPAKSGTVGRAHIEIFLQVGPIQPTEINCVPKYTVAAVPFGIPTSYKKRDIS